ncbi:MAG TPA: DUF6588 family protein, partial [Gillisia sp.]|nr:DUF6588 family protein [Gillisia sp.]
MKQILTGIILCSFSFVAAQADFNDVFAAGVEDAEQFTTDYMAPLSESAIYNFSTGWYNSADAKPLGGFEISIVGNITGFKNNEAKKQFILDPNDYQNLDFADNPGTARAVSSALGDLSGINVFVEGQVAGITVREEFELPSGLSG